MFITYWNNLQYFLLEKVDHHRSEESAVTTRRLVFSSWKLYRIVPHSECVPAYQWHSICTWSYQDREKRGKSVPPPRTVPEILAESLTVFLLSKVARSTVLHPSCLNYKYIVHFCSDCESFWSGCCTQETCLCIRVFCCLPACRACADLSPFPTGALTSLACAVFSAYSRQNPHLGLRVSPFFVRIWAFALLRQAGRARNTATYFFKF